MLDTVLIIIGASLLTALLYKGLRELVYAECRDAIQDYFERNEIE